MSDNGYSEFWISGGELVPGPDSAQAVALRERNAVQRSAMVKISAGPTGTSVSWAMFAANWASLFFAKEWIGTFPGPYTLNYFLSGWFSETIANPLAARQRIDQLIVKSDVSLSSRIYTHTAAPVAHQLPERLRETFEAGMAREDSSVDCRINPDTGRVTVERIGGDSAIAKVWGLSPVSYPCVNGNTYDRVVSRAYLDVLRTGRPHYDHIMAAMKRPDGEVAWIPYQRLVMPLKTAQPSVRVVSESAPVAIRVL
jgi:hypothetical protein